MQKKKQGIKMQKKTKQKRKPNPKLATKTQNDHH